MRAKYVSLVVTISSSPLRQRRSTAPMATNFTSAHTPPTNGTMAPSLLMAMRSEAFSSGQAAKGCACSFWICRIRCPTASVCRRVVEACTTTPNILSRCSATRPNGNSLPKLTSASCACGNRCPSGTCNSLSRGKKPASAVWAGHIRAFHLHLLTSLCLPPPSRPSACLERLTTLLAHQSLAGFTAGCRTHLCRLFDQLRAQAIDLLIHRLFNLRERRLRMGHSPLRDGGSGFLPLLFPTLLQVFWLQLELSLLDCLHNSFPLRQCTTG